MVCDCLTGYQDDCYKVLILILLEYGLRPFAPLLRVLKVFCLNPYSIGIWSAT